MKMAHRKNKKVQVRIEKKHFQDEDMFGMRQLKGLNSRKSYYIYIIC